MSPPAPVDLLADAGESYGRWTLGDDAALLPLLSSAAVACGFHAGDPATLEAVLAQAAAAGVAVGAQVGYPDLVGFGRRVVEVPGAVLRADVVYQAGGLVALASAAGTPVRFVKPHGALYHRVTVDPEQARGLVEACERLGGLPLVTAPGGVAARLAAAAGLRVVVEAYADRGYRADGSLVPRGEPGDLLTDAAEVAERVRRLAVEGVVRAVDGTDVELATRTVCLHGDTPGAVATARAVRAALADAGVPVAAVW